MVPNFCFSFFSLFHYSLHVCLTEHYHQPDQRCGGDEFYGRHRLQGTGIEKKKRKHCNPSLALPAIQFAGIMVGGLQQENEEKFYWPCPDKGYIGCSMGAMIHRMYFRTWFVWQDPSVSGAWTLSFLVFSLIDLAP